MCAITKLFIFQVTPPPVPTQTSTPEAAPQTDESGTYNGWGVLDSGIVGNPTQHAQTSDNISPSAPPIPEDLDGDSVTNDMKDEGSSSLCAICFEAPIGGSCISCGHMAGSWLVCVNVYYVMGFRPSYFTCIAHLYLYYTLLVPHTYASYIRH